jgi:hypothetical protein
VPPQCVGSRGAACQPPFPSLPQRLAAVAQLQQLPQVQRQTRFLWETPEATTVRAAIRTRAVRQLADEPTDPPLSSDRGPGCRTAPAAPTGSAPDAVFVADAGGQDGTGRDSDDAVCQLADEPADPPLSSDRGPGCRTAPAAPTGSAPDAVFVADAGGQDGTGRDSDETVCQLTAEPADPTAIVRPRPGLSHSSSSSHRFSARRGSSGRRRRPRRYGPRFGRDCVSVSS